MKPRRITHEYTRLSTKLWLAWFHCYCLVAALVVTYWWPVCCSVISLLVPCRCPHGDLLVTCCCSVTTLLLPSRCPCGDLLVTFWCSVTTLLLPCRCPCGDLLVTCCCSVTTLLLPCRPPWPLTCCCPCDDLLISLPFFSRTETDRAGWHLLLVELPAHSRTPHCCRCESAQPEVDLWQGGSGWAQFSIFNLCPHMPFPQQ